MNESGSSHVKQALKAFHKFLACYEDPSWSNGASIDDIKSGFKLGQFVEKSAQAFKEKGFLGQFLAFLGRDCPYSPDFFELANDRLLAKLLKCPALSETTLDVAVRVYTALYPRERFQSCLRACLESASALRTIADFVNTSVPDLSCMENLMIVKKWSEYSTRGEDLKLHIESYLSMYNVEEKLPRLIGMLALQPQVLDGHKRVTDQILQCLLAQMSDRSLLSKAFWLALFEKVNLDHLGQACRNFPNLLQSLLDFVEYLGIWMAKKPFGLDSSPSVSFCHAITSKQLVAVLKALSSDQGAAGLVAGTLKRAQQFSNAPLWHQIARDIFGAERS